MQALGYISHSINDLLQPANTVTVGYSGMGAPGDTYIVTDTRSRSVKDLDKLASLQRYKIEKYDGDANLTAENGVVLVPVLDLNFDTKNFQNRDSEYSEASVSRIIDAVDDGDFNWAVFDPITIWRNPTDGKYYVLSGHSRSEAFRRLAMSGKQADGRKFDRIPAKVFEGTFEQAKELALNSNTLSTKETDLERANYYRERRAKLLSNGLKSSEVRKRLLELARKNATKIIYLSYLKPNGFVVDAVSQTADGASVDKNRVAVMAEWVGHLRHDFPQLTDAHEVELFNFLKNGHYGVDVRNFADFAQRVSTAIEKHTEWGKFDAAKSLNLEKNLGKSENEKRYDAELLRLKQEWSDAENVLNRKLSEFKARQRNDASITNAAILKAVQPYKDAAIMAKAAYLAFRDKRGEYLKADEAQMSLFGVRGSAPFGMSCLGNLCTGSDLGKPTIKFEFETNSELADFLKDTQKAAEFAETINPEGTTKTAADTAPNTNRRRNQKAIPTDTPLSLMPSGMTPGLPPSPTSPKALPPSDGQAKALPDVVEPTSKPSAATAQYVPQNSFKIYGDFDVESIEPNMRPDDIITYFHRQYGYDPIVGMVSNVSTNPRYSQYAIEFYDYDAIDAAKILGTKAKDNFLMINPSIASQALRQIQQQRPLILWAYRAPLKVVPTQSEASTPRQDPEIEFDNIKYYNDAVSSVLVDMPKSMGDLSNWFKWAYHRYDYPDWVVSFVQEDNKANGKGKYYQFYFLDKDKDLITRSVLRPNQLQYRNNYIIVTKLSEVERIEDALRADGNRHLIILRPYVYDDGLGKPTIKLEFENNGELLSLFDAGTINGDKEPAAIFNCPESQLDCKGYRPTYKILPSYDHLIDPADGQSKLVGYGFEEATLSELIEACKYYRQVARLAQHLKGSDALQTAFNIWHFLHTNVRYNYDAPGLEEIRVPARVWADRFSGVDCDCLAVFTACLLLNLGYKPQFEIVGFDNSPKYSHIYVTLDGYPIDRVLPSFLDRPKNITKTKIMDIPVYQLSGCNLHGGLSGIYDSTLRRIATGTASAQDCLDFRKAQVLVSLQGCNPDAATLAEILMPYVGVVADDGAYYFTNANVAKVATEADSELRQMQSQNLAGAPLAGWFDIVRQKVKAASEDVIINNPQCNAPTIVVIINPKREKVQVKGEMVKADLPTVNPLQSEPTLFTATLPESETADESPAEKKGSNVLWWALGVVGLTTAAVCMNEKKGKKK